MGNTSTTRYGHTVRFNAGSRVRQGGADGLDQSDCTWQGPQPSSGGSAVPQRGPLAKVPQVFCHWARLSLGWAELINKMCLVLRHHRGPPPVRYVRYDLCAVISKSAPLRRPGEVVERQVVGGSEGYRDSQVRSARGFACRKVYSRMFLKTPLVDTRLI